MGYTVDRVKAATRYMHHKYGRAVLAPMTGQDARAWAAFVMLLDLYAVADSFGRRHALRAMTSTVYAAQPSVRRLFVDVVTFSVDGRDGAILGAELLLGIDVLEEEDSMKRDDDADRRDPEED